MQDKSNDKNDNLLLLLVFFVLFLFVCLLLSFCVVFGDVFYLLGSDKRCSADFEDAYADLHLRCSYIRVCKTYFLMTRQNILCWLYVMTRHKHLYDGPTF